MKKILLSVCALFLTGYCFGQTGTINDPYDHLYINDFVKVGTNSLWLNSTQVSGSENRLFSTNGSLTINGVHAANGPVPNSPGNNTFINPLRGTVGIGVNSTPQAKLDISIGEDYLYRPDGVRITTPIAVIAGGPTSNNSVFHIQKEYQLSSGSPIYTKTQFFVGTETGNVGINTDEPTDKLHVHEGRIRITGNNSYGGPMLLFGGSASTAPAGQWGIEYIEQGSHTGLNFWKPSGSNNVGNYYLFLSDNGKVSIGLDPNAANTFNGEYKLYVGTGIMTEKVKVAIRTSNDWADDVFAPGYHLQSLEEVKAFIDAEQHLPGIPSADEVVENGINVAEMDAMLLRKIEELTLHMIELQAQNKALQERISDLEN